MVGGSFAPDRDRLIDWLVCATKRRSLFLFFLLNFFPYLFCVSRLSRVCLARCLIYCLAGGFGWLIFVIITDGYDVNACLIR